jgi:hypothetical protein
MSLIYQNPYEIEGAGAQYQRMIGILAIARKHNLHYIHSKIQLEHNYDNEEKWDEKWDDFFNINALSATSEHTISREMFIRNINLHHIHNISSNHLVKCMIPFQIIDKDPDAYYTIIQDDIRKAYAGSKQKKNTYLFDKNKKNIAVHVRVHNQRDLQEYSKEYETNTGRHNIKPKHYHKIITELQSKYEDADIHIFSQTRFDEIYSCLRDIPNINIHLDEVNAFDTFHHMCMADILVMSSSSFSYLAGIYNANTVIYIPFWHPPLNNWIVAHE